MNGDTTHIIRAIEKLEKTSDQRHQGLLSRMDSLDKRLITLYERQSNGGIRDARVATRLDAHLADCTRHRSMQRRVWLAVLGAILAVGGGVVLSIITG